MSSSPATHRHAPNRARSIVSGTTETTRRVFGEDTRLFELLAGAFLFWSTAVPGIPIMMPGKYLAMALLITVAFLRRPQFTSGMTIPLAWVFAALSGFLAWTSFVSATAGSVFDWQQRLLRIAIVIVFLFVVASGRLDLPSLIRGYALGLILNAALFYAGIAPRPYGALLTGYAGDKNSAAMQYLIAGVLLITVMTTRWAIATVIVVFGGLVIATGSRTTMSAAAAAAIWIVLFSRWGLLIRLAGAAAIISGLNYLEENFARIGTFADRTGSDWFRGEIASAAARKLETIPWHGLGLGEAYVQIPNGRFFFHNGFDTLRVEGGWVALIVVLAITIWVCMRPIRTEIPTMQSRITEGATIALFVCAWQLGEVFFTVSWALVMAVAMQQQMRPTDDQALLR